MPCVRACRVCARRGGGDERGEAGPPPAREGGGRWRRRYRGGGNTCRQPVRRGGRAAARAEGKEGGAGGGRPLPTSHDPTRARKRARPAGTSGPATGPDPRAPSPLIFHGPRPASRSPRSARIGSRGTPRRPAGRRRSGRPRDAEGGGEGAETEGGGDRRGIGTATLAPSRGAAAARARPNLAGACGAKTLPGGGASGGTRLGV